MSQLYIGTGKIGPRLYLCALMDYESRMILEYEFGSTNSEKLKQKTCLKAGLETSPPVSRYVSSFFSSLSAEQMSRYRFRDNEERKDAAFDWIKYYNFERSHSALGYKTPAEVYYNKHPSNSRQENAGKA